MAADREVIERKLYGLGELMSEVGGLISALFGASGLNFWKAQNRPSGLQVRVRMPRSRRLGVVWCVLQMPGRRLLSRAV